MTFGVRFVSSSDRRSNLLDRAVVAHPAQGRPATGGDVPLGAPLAEYEHVLRPVRPASSVTSSQSLSARCSCLVRILSSSSRADRSRRRPGQRRNSPSVSTALLVLVIHHEKAPS